MERLSPVQHYGRHAYPLLLRLFMLPALLWASLSAQTLERKVFSSGGGQGFAGVWQVPFTFGEPIVGTDMSGPPNLTKGFHQQDSINTVLALPAPRPLVRQQGQHALLRWTYDQPAEIDFFLLSRRIPGQAFEEVGRVVAGLSSDYEFVDPGVTALGEDQLHYQVWAYSKGGTLIRSAVVELYLSLDGQMGIRVYPVPASDQLIIEASGETAGLRYTLLNATGQVLLSRDFAPPSGQTETIDLRDFAAGIYWLRWQNDRGAEGNIPLQVVR